MADLPVGAVPAPAVPAPPAMDPRAAANAARESARAAKVASAAAGVKAIFASEPSKSDVEQAAQTPSIERNAVTAKPAATAPTAAATEAVTVPPIVEDEKPDADTSKRLDMVAKAEQRSREKIAAERADHAMQVAALERKQAEFNTRAAEFAELQKLARKNPLEALKRLGLESEDDYEAIARSTYPLSKTGKADPKARGAADSILKDRESSATVDELRQQIADLKSMVEGGMRASETEKFTNSYLDDAIKAVPAETHVGKMAPDIARQALLAIGTQMQSAKMVEDGLDPNKDRPRREHIPSHAEVVAEAEKRAVRNLEQMGFTPAEIAARLKPAKAVTTPAPKALDITAPISTRTLNTNPDRKAREVAASAELKRMFTTT